MTQLSLRFSGFGGQGIVLASVIMAHGAICYEDNFAIQTQSYGPESRGGSSKADVIINTKEVNYPLIDTADVLVALSEESFNKYEKETHNKSLIIIDPTFYSKIPVNSKRIIQLPASSLADQLGNRLVANMVLLGTLIELKKIIEIDTLEKSIKDNVPEKFYDINMEGVKKGILFAKTLKGSNE